MHERVRHELAHGEDDVVRDRGQPPCLELLGGEATGGARGGRERGERLTSLPDRDHRLPEDLRMQTSNRLEGLGMTLHARGRIRAEEREVLAVEGSVPELLELEGADDVPGHP